MKLVNPLGRKAETNISESGKSVSPNGCGCASSRSSSAYDHTFILAFTHG